MQQGPGPSVDEMGVFKRFAWTMYVFLFCVLGLYWYCLWFLLRDRQPVDMSFGFFRTVLAVLAVADGAIVLYWFFFRVKPLLNDTSGQAQRLIPRLRANYIVCWIVSEAIAVYGLASALLTATIADYTPYFLASVALLVVCYPRMPQTLSSGPIG
jgi:hypothetical protein